MSLLSDANNTADLIAKAKLAEATVKGQVKAALSVNGFRNVWIGSLVLAAIIGHIL